MEEVAGSNPVRSTNPDIIGIFSSTLLILDFNLYNRRDYLKKIKYEKFRNNE
jgi:hypothetical protein